jgi:microcystin-dependent protein
MNTEEYIPVGYIVSVRDDFVPQESWLPCDGTIVSEEEYPELYSILGNNYANYDSDVRLPNLSSEPVKYVIYAGKKKIEKKDEFTFEF